MRIGQTVGIVLGSLLVILFAITFLLPEKVPHARSEILCAPPETLFSHFNDLERLAQWSSLVGAEAVEREYDHQSGAHSGDRSGVGARVRLLDERDRWIALEITESEPLTSVAYHFSTYEDVNSRARVSLRNEEGNTEVTVRIVQEFGTLPGRWAIVFIRSALDDFLRNELAGLVSHLDEQGYVCPASGD